MYKILGTIYNISSGHPIAQKRTVNCSWLSQQWALTMSGMCLALGNWSLRNLIPQHLLSKSAHLL